MAVSRKTLCQWQDSQFLNRNSVSPSPGDTPAMCIYCWCQVSVNAASSTSLFQGPTGGIMGLAFQSVAHTGALPFWQALLNSNQFTSPEISFYLTRYITNITAPPEEPGGVLTLGGTNSSLFTGNIEFLNMSSSALQGYWSLQMSGIYVHCILLEIHCLLRRPK